MFKFKNGFTRFSIFIRRYSKVGIMKYLNVAEKNDAAKNIAAILSRGNSSRREGCSPYNKIYEFNAQVFGEQAKMVMTSVSGHLLSYEFAAQYKNWQSCNPLVLFEAPVIKSCPQDYQKIKRTLEREITSCQGLIIWTDCDREGENIGFEIIKVCTDVKPDLRIYRAKFSEITAASVFRALNSLGQPDQNVSDAVDVRQELDLRTGAAFTRLQTLRLRRVFPEKLAEKLISYGSCQFPTLGFVVERYQAIEDFRAEPFWRIKMSHTVNELTTDFNWQRDRLFDKDACQAILDICKEDPMVTVESIETKEKSKWRPLPLDTVEMEKTVSRKLRINAKETMKIAEKLYTQGFISYPRTETNIFPKELNLTNLVEQQQTDERWGLFAQRIMNEGGPMPRQGKKSDQAHPPIHPTKYTNNLTGNEQRLYEYIVRHFLACLHRDAKGFETAVNVDIADEKFLAKGLIILEKNYLDVYIYDKWNAKEINNYREGDMFMPTVLELFEGSTTPPKLLTEADLIALMEKYGIGTDATHAEHIDKIKSREYVGLHENMYFVPGTLGMGLVEGYNNIGLEVSLAKPALRAEFENDLKLICDGLKNPETVRREQIAKYRAVFETVMERMQLIDESLANRLQDRPQQVPNEDRPGNNDDFKSVLKCPKCGNDMVYRNKPNGAGQCISCVNYPQCRNSAWFPLSVDSVEVLDQTCTHCGPHVKKLKIKFKRNLFPGEPNPNILCLGGCDMNVLETLDISPGTVITRRSNTQNINNPQPDNITNRRDGRGTIENSRTNDTFTTNSDNESSWRNNSQSSWRISSEFTRTNNNATTVNNRSSSTNVPGPSGSTNTSWRNNTNNALSGSNSDEILCTCDKEALQLTVRKDGPNQGKKFYKCPDNVCRFFLWAADNDSSGAGPSNASSSSRNTNTHQQPTVVVVECRCPQIAALRTVNKDGPNKGRQFYCCPKSMNEGCRFFQWANEGDGEGDFGDGGGGGPPGDDYHPRSNNSWVSKASKNNSSKTNRPVPYKNQSKGKRKCGICGEEGHTRNRCPHK